MQKLKELNDIEKKKDLEDLKKNIITMGDKELLVLIENKFSRTTENMLSVKEIEDSVSLLNELDMNTRNVGVARMKRAQELNNSVTYIPLLIGFMLAMLTAYYQLFGAAKEVSGLAGLVVTSILLVFFVKLLNSSRHRKGIAIYFQSLLETANNNSEV